MILKKYSRLIGDAMAHYICEDNYIRAVEARSGSQEVAGSNLSTRLF